jgi:hypothetical protein
MGGMSKLTLQRFRISLAVLATTAACAWSAAQAQAMLTIVDGEATVLDGGRNLAATEGLKVADETLVRTTARTSLLRIEWPDGSAADFGPDTQAMLNPRGFGTRGGRTPSVYLLSGWLKLSSMGSGPSAGLLTPRIDVQPFKGALVVMVAGDETWVYAESGGAPLIERDVRPPSNLALKNGEVYLRQGAAKGVVAARPTPAQMQRVPRGFRDSLPLRSAAFKDKTVTGKTAPAPAYAELRDWLVAETALRRTFTRRFAERSRDNDFRAGLVQNLGRHPEWERVLFPERFLPPASAPR